MLGKIEKSLDLVQTSEEAKQNRRVLKAIDSTPVIPGHASSRGPGIPMWFQIPGSR
jgi:hypothetical protein